MSLHAIYLMKLSLRKRTRDLKETWKDSVERRYEIWLKTQMSLPVPGRQLVKRSYESTNQTSLRSRRRGEEKEKKNKRRWSTYNCFFFARLDLDASA